MKAQVQLVVNFYCQVIYTSQGTGSLYHLNLQWFLPSSLREPQDTVIPRMYF